jgi:hypothetical protein
LSIIAPSALGPLTNALAAIESLIRESEDRLAVLAVVADTQSDIGEAQKGRILSL